MEKVDFPPTPTASLLVRVTKKSPFAGLVPSVVVAVGDTMNSNSPAPGGVLMLGSVTVFTEPPAGMDGIRIVPLVMHEMSESEVPRMSVTALVLMLLLFVTWTPIRTTSPASAKMSWSPLRSLGVSGRTTSCGRGTFLQETVVVKETASSGMPLLSSSSVSGGSQISPRPS